MEQYNNTEGYEQFFNKESLSDCSLVSQGGKYFCHRVILASQSLELKTWFGKHQEKTLSLRDCLDVSLSAGERVSAQQKAGVARECLNSFYTQKTSLQGITYGNSFDFLQVMGQLGLKKGVDMVQEYLKA